MTQEAREKNRERRRAIRHERRVWLYEYLLQNPCVDCGEDDPVVLDFDHREGKEGLISRGVNDWGWKRLRAEIAKCDVRCANCHRRRTAVDQRWLMADLHYSS